MAVKNKYFRMFVLCLSVIVVLSCSLVGTPEAGSPDPSAVQTEIAFGISVHAKVVREIGA